jgi:hypothetical protein
MRDLALLFPGPAQVPLPDPEFQLSLLRSRTGSARRRCSLLRIRNCAPQAQQTRDNSHSHTSPPFQRRRKVQNVGGSLDSVRRIPLLKRESPTETQRRLGRPHQVGGRDRTPRHRWSTVGSH